MDSVVIDGVVREAGALTEFETRDGVKHDEREVVLETEERYPQVLLVRVVDAVAQAREWRVGDKVRAWLQFKARKSVKSERWFNDIRAWRVETRN